MRPRDGAKVGATRGDDRICVIGFRDRTDRHRRNANFIAELVRKRGLEETPINRLLLLGNLSGRAIDKIGAGLLEHFGVDRGIGGRIATLGPVMTRQPNRNRLVLWPYLADGAENLERISGVVFVR